MVNDRNPHDFGDGLIAQCCMSGKPNGQHPADYYMKVSNYVRVLGDFARAIDPSVTHANFPVRESAAEESVFRYHDAATSRAGLSAVTARLRLGKVAIIGLGGTGAYILDLVAKTPVEEIHLYDDDLLLAHNAFRAPGAASLDELRIRPLKVDYLLSRYDPMRRNIFPHPTRVTAANVEELRDMAFVFLAVDSGPDKRTIVEHLQTWGIPFIDCGLGVQRNGNSLRGMLRVTTGLSGSLAHLERRISYDDQADDEYEWNIQTADLNMMNAAMAVIRWKRLFGYYVDTKGELNSTYTVARNQMASGDIPA
ncbi:MAG: ThiF family adenylyltransferase [Acidimicrobiales bacterium]